MVTRVVTTRFYKASSAAICIALCVAILWSTAIAAQAVSAGGVLKVQPYTIYSCNASSYAPMPGRDGWFIGRRLIPTNPANGCSGHSWTLVLAQLEAGSHRFVSVHDLLTVPAQIEGGARLITAYDAAVALLNGRYWVAFECGGPGIPGASTCIGPLDGDRIDPTKVYVIVDGNDPREMPYTYSASTPKFLQENGQLYLYWSAIKIQNRPWHWLSVATRGMELTYDPGRPWPLLPTNARGPVRSSDPTHNVEVWANADMYSIQPWKGEVIASAGATGPGCVKPSDRTPGCYRTMIGVSPEPLAVDGFKEIEGLRDQIPANPAEYVRLVIRSNGRASLIGHFVPPTVQSARDVPPGIDEVPVTLPQTGQQR
jgi:hypothetical protein